MAANAHKIMVADRGAACDARVRTAVRAPGARIAVITKFRFMGDTIVATPFLRQLREFAPAAHITLVTSPSAATALAGCPYLDDVVRMDLAGKSRWAHSKELLRVLRRDSFSVTFLLNRSLHCAVIAALAGIPARVGYASEGRARLLTLSFPYAFDRHEVDCHLDMLRVLAAPAQPSLPEMWITEIERERVRNLLQEHGVDVRSPVIGVQPGANDPHIREWGADRFAAVADDLAAELRGAVVIMGGRDERPTAARTVAAMRSRAVDLTGALSLRDALVTIGYCCVWIGNDTGLLHAAVAQNVPSVGLFGPNKILRWGYDTPRHRSLVALPERPARDDEAVRRCMDAITETDVLAAARSVLANASVDAKPRHCDTEDDYSSPYFVPPAEYDSRFCARRR